MDPERARELLQAERTRIERLLGHAAHENDAEPGDDEDPGNLASDLYQDELDEGLREDSVPSSPRWSGPGAARGGHNGVSVQERRADPRRTARSPTDSRADGGRGACPRVRRR